MMHGLTSAIYAGFARAFVRQPDGVWNCRIFRSRIRRAKLGYNTAWRRWGTCVDGIDIVPDGTTVVRSDTHPSPYLLSGTTWLPLVTANSMPPAFVGPRNSTDLLSVGAWEIRICPTLTTKFYMNIVNRMFVTTNSGGTWTQLTNFPKQNDLNSNDQFRGYNYRMAVHLYNYAILFVGTVSGGLQRTLDSGASWSRRTVGTGTGTSGAGMFIAFDQTSSVVDGAEQGIFVCRYGDGVYHSTDGGGTFTKLQHRWHADDLY